MSKMRFSNTYMPKRYSDTGGLWAFVLIIPLFFPTFANAQSVSSCPNVVVGTSPYGVSIYSDCDMEDADGFAGNHLTLSANVREISSGFLGGRLTPAPTGSVSFGRWGGSTLYVENRGSGYSGNCLDMTSTSNLAPTVDQNVYCGRIRNTEGNFVLLRGKWDTGLNTFTNPAVFTTQPGVGVPIAATPVPTMPFYLLLAVSSLLGLTGLRNLK
jgi:hypothetical protein